MCNGTVHTNAQMCNRKMQIVHRCAKELKDIVAHFKT